MKFRILIALGILGSALTAQTGSTVTDYGAAARYDTKSSMQTSVRSIAKDTKFGATKTNPAVSVGASVRGGYASSYASAYSTWIYLREYGWASGADKTTVAAGTTTSKTGKIGDAHAVQTTIAAKDGTTGQVELTWANTSSTGAVVKFVVNVNGTDVATFTPASGNGKTRIDVKAGKNGVVIKVTANGSVSQTGKGVKSYYSTLYAAFKAGQTSSKCTLTPFGKDCGMGVKSNAYTITRKYGSTTYVYDVIEANLTGVDKTATALIALGAKLTKAVKLPGGCDLLISPDVIVPMGSWRTYRFTFRAPKAVATNAQAVALSISGSGAKIEASAGVAIVCPKR